MSESSADHISLADVCAFLEDSADPDLGESSIFAPFAGGASQDLLPPEQPSSFDGSTDMPFSGPRGGTHVRPMTSTTATCSGPITAEAFGGGSKFDKAGGIDRGGSGGMGGFDSGGGGGGGGMADGGMPNGRIVGGGIASAGGSGMGNGAMGNGVMGHSGMGNGGGAMNVGEMGGMDMSNVEMGGMGMGAMGGMGMGSMGIGGIGMGNGVVGSGGLDGGGGMSGGSGLGGFGGPMAASAFGGAMASAFDSASFASQMTSAAYGAPMTLPPQFSGQMQASPFAGQMQTPPQFGGQMQPQAYTPPMFAAPTSAPAPAPMAEIAARASAQQGSAFVPDTLSTQPPPSESGASHVCTWPGCGKGFSSRWSLERHVKNHQSVPPGEQEQPDSFVERRLRERVKSVQQALEKTREKLAQHAKQQEQADAELREARLQGEQQQVSRHRPHNKRSRLVPAPLIHTPPPSGLHVTGHTTSTPRGPAVLVGVLAGGDGASHERKHAHGFAAAACSGAAASGALGRGCWRNQHPRHPRPSSVGSRS